MVIILKLRDNYHLLAGLTIFFWSLAFVLTRLALQYFSPFSLGFLRYFIASVFLIVFLFAAKIKRPGKGDLPWFVLSGFFGFFLYMIAFNKGSQTLTAATGSVIMATVPVLTALAARVFYREKISVIRWAAIAVEFSGVVILTALYQSFSLTAGLPWMFLAALALSLYNLLQRKITNAYSGLQASTFSILAGTALLAVFTPATVTETAGAPPAALFYVIILGIFPGAIAYATWAQALKKAEKTSSVTNYMFLTPFLTTLLGFLLAGEKPDFATIVGGAVILAGLFLFHFGDTLRKKATGFPGRSSSDKSRRRP